MVPGPATVQGHHLEVTGKLHPGHADESGFVRQEGRLRWLVETRQTAVHRLPLRLVARNGGRRVNSMAPKIRPQHTESVYEYHITEFVLHFDRQHDLSLDQCAVVVKFPVKPGEADIHGL